MELELHRKREREREIGMRSTRIIATIGLQAAILAAIPFKQVLLQLIDGFASEKFLLTQRRRWSSKKLMSLSKLLVLVACYNNNIILAD